MRIANARRIDLLTGGVDEPTDIWIRGDRIARSPVDDGTVVDAQGRFVLPGLWDAHVHMTGSTLAARDHRPRDDAERHAEASTPTSGPGSADLHGMVRAAARAASARGLVGVVDMSRADNEKIWRRRVAEGFAELRVRVSVWPEHLDRTIAAGRQDGDPLDDRGLVQQGPLTVSGADDHDLLTVLVGRAARAGLACAVPTVGEAALDAALSAFADSGAHGSLEHPDLGSVDQAAAMAALGLTATMRPGHPLGAGGSTGSPGSARAVLSLRTLARAGVRLALGSDAAASALNPWVAIQAAVRPDRWRPGEGLPLSDALRASTGGVCRLVPGASADLFLLEENPFSVGVERLDSIESAMTVLGGRVVHSTLGHTATRAG